MLTVSAMTCTNAEEHLVGSITGEEEMNVYGTGNFDFSVDAGLLDDIDFSDFFLRLEDGDMLPDLEMDPSEIFAEFEAIGAADEYMSVDLQPSALDGYEFSVCEEEQEKGVSSTQESEREEKDDNTDARAEEEEEVERILVEATENDVKVAPVETNPSSSSSTQESECRRKSSSSSANAKNSQGRKKAKVDWTPELHRRFVQAVEQLGVDKAVPSRILELMGTDSLTRHNIASHLQKYRSHRKHSLAREAEAASWSQRRQMYAAGAAAAKRDANAWPVPTIGFPQPPPHVQVQHFRPLHIWGHPIVDSPRMHIWPWHLLPRAPTPPWAPQPPLPPTTDPSSFWHHHHYMRGPPNVSAQGTPCMAMPVTTTRFPAPPMPGIVPYPMCRPVASPTVMGKSVDAHIQNNAQPSSESIDAAIGDVLAKPWLPLPLGLKPPSLDSVMDELQRQGISKVPPTCG